MHFLPPYGRRDPDSIALATQNDKAFAARKRWSDISSKAIFTRVAYFNSPPWDLLGIKRMPDKAPADIGFWSDTQSRRIVCESGAERRVFSWLERSPEVRWYQEQPVAIPCILDGRCCSYYPDVAVLDSSGKLVVVEVKPLFEMHRQDALIKASAALEYLGKRGIGYLLIDPNGRTLADLARIPYDLKTAKTVESFFHHGPAPFSMARNLLRARCGEFDRNAFISMVVNRDWGITSTPGVRIFRLPEGLSFRPLRADT